MSARHLFASRVQSPLRAALHGPTNSNSRPAPESASQATAWVAAHLPHQYPLAARSTLQLAPPGPPSASSPLEARSTLQLAFLAHLPPQAHSRPAPPFSSRHPAHSRQMGPPPLSRARGTPKIMRGRQASNR
ncbi:unnamed protein product [Linum trigynum]|uniref:Uncharacterized protein n=1 Tax=Linum trigynum TaxID=586398 RepID=A0AAV2F3N8_9ROSI